MVYRHGELTLPFTDVKKSDWSFGDIAYVYEKGLMQGTSATTFSPKMTTSRGMIVTILLRLEGEPVVNYAICERVASAHAADRREYQSCLLYTSPSPRDRG